ncbi:ABC transporter permease subunit [Paenibacillus qinlingensis]|uniref:Aldouronate transport system permease protein n=1 Tax=Paenibacillus qinlingensis TaxID=1837343 RepID=A0ABU1NW88_9BACL|nr:ABC transporter permease subunit [Paenibacillus qinlingensis]MDR6551725.1 putative aldouronate transport system permease protein [Paenibacillus qinlingensis]
MSAELRAQESSQRVIRKTKSTFFARLWRERFIHFLVLPGLLYFVIYKYIPMFGLLIAFQDYSVFTGFWGSEWVGFKHFIVMFNDKEVLRVLWNTLFLTFLQILIAFPVPILLALMLNEIKYEPFKRVLQSIVYLPHFFSWVIVIGLVTLFLKSEGIVNKLIIDVFHMKGISFLTEPSWFMPLIVLEGIWKEGGWSTILFLAAIAGINPQLYEAAIVDGANRFRQIWHITLPGIRTTVILLLILRMGNVLDSGFEQIFLMLNAFTMEVGNVLDTYVYFKGIQGSEFSFAAAVGLFKSIVGFILLLLVNKLVKKLGGQGIF